MEKCKHENIWITEELLWKGYKDESNIYDANNKEAEITRISCDDCGYDFTEDEINNHEYNFS